MGEPGLLLVVPALLAAVITCRTYSTWESQGPGWRNHFKG